MKVFHSEHNGCEANPRLTKKEMAIIINKKKEEEKEMDVDLDKSETTLATEFLVNEDQRDGSPTKSRRIIAFESSSGSDS